MASKTTVSDYITKQPSPQKEICQELRSIILETLPDIQEEMKLGVPWYEGLIYIVSLKDHVNLGFALDKLPEEEANKLKGGGKTMKCLELRSLNEIDPTEVKRLIGLVTKSR